MKIYSRLCSIFAIACLLLLIISPAQSESTLEVTISEWTVPWPDSRPRDPDVAPDGTIWLVGQKGHYVAHFDPDTAEFSRHDLPDGTGPHNIIVDDDETLWVAGNRKGWIGQMDPETGSLITYPMPDEDAGDPHTQVFDDHGNIWFTVQWGNFIGRMNKTSGEVELAEVATPKARPYGIKLDSRGTPWVALLGSNALATVDPETMEVKEIAVAPEDARLRRLAISSDDRIWWVDYAQGWVGYYDPQSGEIESTQRPNPSGPYAVAVDAQDRLWFFETRRDPNMLVGIDTTNLSVIAEIPVPSGGGAVRHMVYDAARNSLWFGTDTNNLGRARLPD
jgi:virginiamycin B lyase